MKLFSKVSCLLLATALAASCSGCGSNSAYSDYSKAYKKTTDVGSMYVKLDLEVDDGSTDMESSGEMKMNKDNLYYEMEINGSKIVQYLDDGRVHTLVDGEEQIYSTSNSDSGPQRADPDADKDDNNEKTDESSFNTNKFLEEFSGILEAGKIKESGVLDPIPSNVIKEITAGKDGKDAVYSITFPNEFLSKFLNILVSEQLKSNNEAVSFDELKNFKCTAKENEEGYIYYIEYEGSTTVTVSGELMSDGKEKTFDLNFDLEATIQNPGQEVEVQIP